MSQDTREGEGEVRQEFEETDSCIPAILKFTRVCGLL